MKYRTGTKQDKIIEELIKSTSMPNRVAAHCVWCIYDPMAKGVWQKQVGACEMDSCPLHEVRLAAIERKD